MKQKTKLILFVLHIHFITLMIELKNHNRLKAHSTTNHWLITNSLLTNDCCHCLLHRFLLHLCNITERRDLPRNITVLFFQKISRSPAD